MPFPEYFLSFVVDTEPDILPDLQTDAGIDLGLSQRSEAGSPRKGQTTQAGIPGL